MDTAYVSGDWLVKPGCEQEFVGRWEEFIGWSAQHARGARSFVLLRDDKQPGHFISVGTWDGPSSVTAWRIDPGFPPRFKACADLCERVHASDYTLVAQAAPQPAGVSR